MRAVITVVGKDSIGILAKVAEKCANYNINVIDVTQSVLQEEIFTMIMLVDIKKLSAKFSDFSNDVKMLGKKQGLEIHVMHEDIFNVMHRL